MTMVSVVLLSQDFTTAKGEVSAYFVVSRSIFPMHSLPMICFTTAKINVYEPFGLNSFINTMSLCSTAPRVSKSSGLRWYCGLRFPRLSAATNSLTVFLNF